MKKIKILLILLMFPIFVNAKEVEKIDYEVTNVFINSSIDFVGSMHVEEAVVVKGSLNKFTREIDYRDVSLPEYKKGKINFSKSSIYNAKAVSLKKASSFKIKEKDIDFSLLEKANEDYKEKKIAKKGDSKIYTKKDNDNGVVVSVYNPNEEGYIVYYFEYYIDQVVVLHEDVAELYYKFIPDNFDDIKNMKLQLVAPGDSSADEFKYYAHGSLLGKVSPISERKDKKGNYLYRGLLANIDNVKKGNGVSIRMTFNKDLVSMGQKLLNKSGEKALEKIIKVEEHKNKKSNNQRKINKIFNMMMNICSVLFMIGTIILSIMFLRKRKDISNIIILAYSILGLILLLLDVIFVKNNLIIYILLGIIIIFVIFMSILKKTIEKNT